jgi:TetR/AcrR family acrAB operon transcriptional repressor
MVRRTKADAQVTRTSILDAAELVFERQGVSRSSLQDIASAAGVTRGAVYWHFQDKADVFNAMMERAKLPLEEAAQQLEACSALSPLERLRQMLGLKLKRLATDPQMQRVFTIATLKMEYVDELQAVQERYREAVSEHLATIARALQRAGIDPRHAVGVHALMLGLIHAWTLAPDSFDIAEDGSRAIDTHLAGLTAAAPAAAQMKAG